MRPSAARPLLTAGALSAALLLSGCSGDADPGTPSAQGTASPTAAPVVPGPTSTRTVEPVEADPAAVGKAPSPATSLPAPVQELVTTTDVGQYLATPRAGLTDEQIAGTLAKLAKMEGVQSAVQREDGLIDLQFRGDPTPQARTAAVRQLAALGEVIEGV